MANIPLRATIEQLFGHHNRLQGLLRKSATQTREQIAWLDDHPDQRPDFATGEKWDEVRKFNIRQAEWDEERAAEHLEFQTAIKRILESKLPDEL